MRLKRLEMAGFKSFVDPTKIDLDQGITAIVGPNGCGKSNIVDALRWVLGEHSARHLRGGVMDDLIFQGSETRAPVGICDVELTFAVECGALSPPYHELDEIRVRRRLTREGGSDAFINGKMVRIKDVVDLFLDTGISTRAYAIVEQGSIARMVTARPDERRVIFEEAAGVMKYRARRREAERRMKDTRQNLDRVLDLLDEVRSQCRSLRQQASRAERFRQLQDEFSRTRAISFALRYRELQQRYQEIEQQLKDARREEAEAERRLGACEQAVNAARERLLAHEQEAERLQDRLRQAEQAKGDLQRQVERLAGERRLLDERRNTLAAGIAERQASRARLLEERAMLQTRLNEQDDTQLLTHQREAQDAVEAARLEVRRQGQLRDRLLVEFERLQHRSEQAAEQRHRAAQALARLATREESLGERRADLIRELEQQRQTLQAAEAAWGQAQQARAQGAAALDAAQAQLERCRSAREQASVRMGECEAAVREWRGAVQELRGRSWNQDLSDSLRERLRADGGIWMDESLHVPEGLERAVAAALRGRSADLRLPDGTDVAAWQEALQHGATSSEAPPVALFVGPAASARPAAESLAAAIGVGPEHPLYDVFAPVRLVEDIAATDSVNGCVVSRDGWRREESGWLIPPAASRTAERLATQRQLRQAEARLRSAEADLLGAKRVFDAAEQALMKQQQEWQRAHLRATESDSACRAAEAAVARLQEEVVALQRHQLRVQGDLDEAAAERAHWQAQAGQIEQVDPQAVVEAEARLKVRKDALRQAEQRLEQARRQQAQSEQALALFAQARDNLTRQLSRLQQEAIALQQQIEADGRRLDAAEAALRQASDQQLLDDELARAADAVEASHRAMNELRAAGHALQRAQHEAEAEERRARRSLQQASEQRQALAVAQAQDAARLQDLAAEMAQRCQKQPDTLLQQLDAMDRVDDAEAVMARALELEERLERFGPVNLLAIEEFEQASEREGFLAEQAADLEASLTTLGDTIARIDRTTRQRFREVFEQTNANFKQTFPQLFSGGRAELKLDGDDILTAGVEVIAQPPGKRLQDVTLLSGGEKALTAVALVFSIFKIKPAPFCVLDEVDAPLDDANVGRFADMVRELADRVQFLAISHNKITMQKSDRLIGVSMPEPGVSKIVAVDMAQMPE